EATVQFLHKHAKNKKVFYENMKVLKLEKCCGKFLRNYKLLRLKKSLGNITGNRKCLFE
ncbi:hypothetical protein LCGC14_2808910, partial [marine sediment metagenome]